MTKKPGLVPAVTTDKNGKITTVYRKPAGVPETNLVIPAPFAPAGASTGRTETINKLSSLVVETLSLDGEHAARIAPALSEYPDDLIAKIDHHFTNDTHGVYFTAMAIDTEEDHIFVNEMMTFGPSFQTDSYELACSMIRSLHHYKQLPQMDDYSLASKELRMQCFAILSVVESLDDRSYYNPEENLPVGYTLAATRGKDLSYLMIKSDDLIALILERPEESETIADIIIERQTSDTELIRSMISNGDSRALNPGLL